MSVLAENSVRWLRRPFLDVILVETWLTAVISSILWLNRRNCYGSLFVQFFIIETSRDGFHFNNIIQMKTTRPKRIDALSRGWNRTLFWFTFALRSRCSAWRRTHASKLGQAADRHVSKGKIVHQLWRHQPSHHVTIPWRCCNHQIPCLEMKKSSEFIIFLQWMFLIYL